MLHFLNRSGEGVPLKGYSEASDRDVRAVCGCSSASSWNGKSTTWCSRLEIIVETETGRIPEDEMGGSTGT